MESVNDMKFAQKLKFCVDSILTVEITCYLEHSRDLFKTNLQPEMHAKIISGKNLVKVNS